MTVALADAKKTNNLQESKPYIVSPDMVYADDTMLLASDPEAVQRYLDSLAQVGQTYGLELNLEKDCSSTYSWDTGYLWR